MLGWAVRLKYETGLACPVVGSGTEPLGFSMIRDLCGIVIVLNDNHVEL
jgi:hypothetical protein